MKASSYRGAAHCYLYGDALFTLLNTNNYDVAEHKQAFQEAVASDSDVVWRAVTAH